MINIRAHAHGSEEIAVRLRTTTWRNSVARVRTKKRMDDRMRGANAGRRSCSIGTEGIEKEALEVKEVARCSLDSAKRGKNIFSFFFSFLLERELNGER